MENMSVSELRALAQTYDIHETPMLPAHVQRDEDAALGAAWRRCEAALPEGWCWMGLNRRPDVWHASIWYIDDQLAISGFGKTPIEALIALAEALEERNAG